MVSEENIWIMLQRLIAGLKRVALHAGGLICITQHRKDSGVTGDWMQNKLLLTKLIPTPMII